ncbi:ion transporter [Aureliella helgolandensis]|uniref:Cyclic nucleotide-gated potassium channel n=1 Tax=Aureliella helgolandensis TaxID=2527968 RepID=A0A518G4D5_9BACT|nr:ion transporter [Aureliella helgolandensis]QDV23463.1 Cyclic nucleotide-gated potassium channel [Aureliella helgolandensis]
MTPPLPAPQLPATSLPRQVELFLQLLICLSLAAFAIETLPDLSAQTRLWLDRFEVLTVAIFSVEYMWRLAIARNRVGFVTSFFGVTDLLSVLPFYLSLGVDLRSVRALRLLRLFRLLKLARYSSAIRRFHVAFLIAREELVLFFCVTCISLFLAAVGIYHFENPAQPEVFASIFHSLWWAVATLTTVGYGDIYPITVGGKIFTFVVLIVGLGIVSVPAGLVASALSKARDLEP